MIRKLVLAVAAIAALGTVSLTATAPASAHGFHGGGFHGGGFHGGGFHGGHHFHGGHFRGGYGLYSVGVYDTCLRTRWVVNSYGELVRRVINVCD